LVDETGRPWLIDWEWTHVGDPARDLAFVGGQVHAEPWFVDLDDDGIQRQILAYLEERDALGAPVDAAAARGMRARRDAYLLHEVFFLSA
ncbi:hypothetical protein ACI3GN_15520, partial [Lactiplantibacillus plantarum]|uniref:hypothetical protein n=1 Tax=Lactiplantibacillus plantarum TaxID=1590 RepID=UPI00385214AD